MSETRKRQVSGEDVAPKKQKTEDDEVDKALKKIKQFVGMPSKFAKAGKLLVNLCQEGHIDIKKSKLFFEVVTSAMADCNVCYMESNRRIGAKLISKAVEIASVFGEEERKQLEVYQIWTICRSELHTDDSFAFGKNMTKLKELAIALPVATEEDESVYSRWKENASRRASNLKSTEVKSEDDEGLHLAADVSHVWSSEECLAARREAIVDWMEAAKDVYSKQWACTAIDLAIKVLNNSKDKFTKPQRERIEALFRFSKDQKMRRQQGPSAMEKRRDANKYDAARSEWSKARISNRRAVGNEGDHRHEAWLG